MKNWHSNKYTAFVWAWLLLISLLTLLKIAPDSLNADILINSVMSLQNLTLYYWGQNRLLNVLPLAIFFIKDPTFNLATLMALTVLSFYGLLYILSAAAVRLIVEKNEKILVFYVFLVTSSAIVLVFSSHAISEITIGHIEYSFPSLLLVYAGLRIFRQEICAKDWLRLIFPIFALFLAIGINPSTVIPALFITISFAFYKKLIALNAKIFFVVSICSFFIWDFVSKKYGSLPYNEFKLEILYSGIYKVLIGLLEVINLPVFLIAIFSVSIAKVFYQVFCKAHERKIQPIISYITNIILIFSVAWIFLFSISRWVEMNEYNWRYFIYILIALIFLFMVKLSDSLRNWDVKYSNILAALIAIMSIVTLTPHGDRVKFDNYKVFQRVNALTETGSSLYAGDYWDVWPSVLRDMMNGYEAYGLTYRGEANKNAARDYVLRKIKERGRAKVFCLNDTIRNCISQVVTVAGPLHAVEISLIKDKVSLVEFVEKANFLDFKGKDLLSLPSQVGIVEGLEKRSQSSAGFMIYGPYTPFETGKYFLSVLGSSAMLKDAYIDVVSDHGAKVHSKIELKPRSDNYLLRNVEVDLPGGVNDLEVRVWVGENDEIKLYGYSLKSF